MSKVKGEFYDINKRKLMHCLRRKETYKKKRRRITKFRNCEYRFCRGYYLKYDYDRDIYTERLHRFNTNIKRFRKPAKRKVRYSAVDELYQRNAYKKLYDIDWTYG